MKRKYPSYSGDSAELRAEEIAEELRHAIERASMRVEVLTGVMPITRVVVNRDNTVDGELRFPTGKWDELEELASALSDASPGKRVPEIWVSTGCISWPKPGEIITGIPGKIGSKKIQRYATFWQFGSRVANNLLNFREGILRELRRKRRRVPKELYVRLHWNPQGKKPEGR